MSDLRVKIFATPGPGELEDAVNDFLSKADVVPEDFQFALNGLDLNYNLALLYREKK